VKDRFQGIRGKELLVVTLRDQRLVEHDQEIASRLADVVELREYTPGTVLVEQGAGDNSLLLILSGEAAVTINGRLVGTRIAGESIGEMAMVSASSARSATVTAVKPTLAAVLSEEHFSEIATSYPRVWKPIAKIIAGRLREREKFHRLPNPMPVIFIGSSVEGLAVARAIVAGFKFDKFVPKLWSTPGVFEPGGATLDTLMKEVDAADFAMFVFGPDDKITSRDERYRGPRDNVIFELGLFMGRLDRERALIVKEHSSDIKIPTDLLGVTPVTYVSKAGQDLASAVESVCNDVRKIVEKYGAI
jgi:CRP/FNR family transcriptional regulator, cyclic AMP receptor protein